MALAPLFKIGDVVYLAESAALGELESYKVSSINQPQPGRWIYQIVIDKRPPDTQTVEDRVDLRFGRELYFDEVELVTLCEAVDTALLNMQSRINRTMQMIEAFCGTTFKGGAPPKGDPRFSLGDTVYLKASAERGFMETYQVTNIHRRPNIQEYVYELNIQGNPQVFNTTLDLTKFRQLFFREPELIDQCEALNIALGTLDRKVARLLAIKEALCPGFGSI